jgi:hypothetical protein
VPRLTLALYTGILLPMNEQPQFPQDDRDDVAPYICELCGGDDGRHSFECPEGKQQRDDEAADRACDAWLEENQ